MQNNFQIDYNGQLIDIDLEQSTEKNGKIFKIHLPEGEIQIQQKEDNEGADHWFDLKTNQSTDQIKKIGASITAYLLEK
ncbi:MAG: hypothetical protein H0W62_13720 [Chitinophagales bacterium]|nr:hypothetical protein [Chitinophagales bacterium]